MASREPGARFLLESAWIAETLFPNFHERLDMEVAGGIRFQPENRYEPAEAAVVNRFTVSRGVRTEMRVAGAGGTGVTPAQSMMRTVAARSLAWG